MQEKFTHGGNVHEILRRQSPAVKLLDFSANINPLGLAAEVKAAIQDNIGQVVHYPDPEATDLKQALADHYKLLPDTIILGNGAVELLYVLFHTLRPKTVLIPVPSFGEYERAALACQADIIYHELAATQDFSLTLSPDFIDKIKQADCLILGNPNNPTGNLLPVKVIEACLAAAQKHNCLVVVDESFIDFRADQEAYSCRKLLADYDNLFLLQSLTKFYAIPGLRLGFAATNKILAKKLELGKDPWNVNLLAQKAGVAALNATAYQEKTRASVKAEGERLWLLLQDLPKVKAYKPTVNFILFDISGTGYNAALFREKLLQRQIMIRDCSNYPGLSTGYVRVAVKAPNDNDALLAALQAVLKESTMV